MKELKEFVARKNAMARLLNRRQVTLNHASDRQAIASDIDCALSPENLHCDGEISRAEANRKYRFLSKAAGQLIQLDPTVKIYEYSE